jgi:hypothetical protein
MIHQHHIQYLMVVGAIGEENQILLRKPLLPNNVSPPFYIYLKESF